MTFILLFTLGALAGLPAGYGTAKFWAEMIKPALELSVETYTLVVALDYTLRGVDDFKARWPA